MLAYLLLGLVWMLLAGVVVHIVYGIRLFEAGMVSFATLMVIFIGLSALIIAQQEARFQRDLIRRERIRRIQQEQSLKFRLMTEHSVDLVSMASIEGLHEYVSPSHKVILGLEAEAVMNQHPASLIHPSDLDRLGDWHSYPLSEFRLRTASGDWKWVQGYRYLIRWEGHDYSVGIARDVTALRSMQQTVVEYAERLKILSRKLLETQENERRHLARELHDEVGQTLTAAKLGLHAMADLFQLSRREKLYSELVASLDRVLTQIRTLSLNLHPSLLDDLGLVAAIRGLGTRMATLSGLKLSLNLPESDPRFPPLVEITGYRVIQEALNNIARHAGALRIEITLAIDSDGLKIRIQDDGRGFDLDAMRRRVQAGSNLGLLGMEERVQLAGGQFSLQSEPGKGTTIEIQFALKGAPASSRAPTAAEEM
ncbi:multi-sensor signal transduction histidine kinase [mine drainage metagenome]|uniref:Oxygen sensor histidine kinase NreB n=2 Tax=mine drainage metagenome TaxID=410659 RepID=T1A9T1_9ZZZZ